MDSRFTSRKWVLTLVCLMLAVIARACTWIDGAQFVSLLTWSVGLYMCGNVGQAVADKISIGSKS
jgi:hypothetical protein